MLEPIGQRRMGSDTLTAGPPAVAASSPPSAALLPSTRTASRFRSTSSCGAPPEPGRNCSTMKPAAAGERKFEQIRQRVAAALRLGPDRQHGSTTPTVSPATCLPRPASASLVAALNLPSPDALWPCTSVGYVADECLAQRVPLATGASDLFTTESLRLCANCSAS